MPDAVIVATTRSPIGRTPKGSLAGMRPDELSAQIVQAALADGRFLVLPHPEVAGYYAHRATEPDRWLAGMNRLQPHVDAEDVTA